MIDNNNRVNDERLPFFSFSFSFSLARNTSRDNLSAIFQRIENLPYHPNLDLEFPTIHNTIVRRKFYHLSFSLSISFSLCPAGSILILFYVHANYSAKCNVRYVIIVIDRSIQDKVGSRFANAHILFCLSREERPNDSVTY